MGSIRPLFTITVLVVVGAYLYVKINEGPVRPHAGAQDGDQSQDGVPPLAAAGGGATLAQDSAAAAWPPATSSVAPPTATIPPGAASAGNANSAGATTPAAGDMANNGLPEVPPIPDLPELPQTSNVTPPAAQPAATLPTELPKNVPAARYGNEAGQNPGADMPPGAPNTLPVLPTNPAPTTDNTTPLGTTGVGTTSPAFPNVANVLPDTPNDGAGAGVAAPSPGDRYGASTTPAAIATPPLNPAATPSALPATAPVNPTNPPSIDRYGFGTSTASLPPAATPITSQPSTAAGALFAASWPAIQAALDRRDLKQAHQLLSKWHNDESLAPADTQKVEDLLGQLAGTVIYSTEHQLEPARVVMPGETLETIAKEYNVPWQLLAKINSIPAPDQLRPGQELKVVRGPFSAVVDLHRHELMLEVDGRYAGTFPVTIPAGVTEGQWTVDQKLGGTSSVQQFVSSAGPADRTIVLRNAASPGPQPGGPTLTIAGGTAVPAPGVAALRVSLQDAEDLSDILSVGSRVIVRR